MTGWPGASGDLAATQVRSLRRVLGRWREHRGDGAMGDGGHVELVDIEIIHAGRTGVLDVVAEMDGLLAHAVLGLHRPGDELHVLGVVDEPALGQLEDDDGLAVVVDAMHDADASRVLFAAVAGEGAVGPGPGGLPVLRPIAARSPVPPPTAVTLLRDDAEVTTLGFDHRLTLSVFASLRRGPHPGMALLAGLDAAGFNHLAAPVALWRRAGRDLGVAQELLAGATGGWAIALASLRDLFAAGTAPGDAGGDFAPEALALGTMAARMHLALDRAFGRRAGDVGAWSDDVEAMLVREAPRALDASVPGLTEPTLRQVLASLRDAGLRPSLIRTHGDFHLGRSARTDHGWVLADCMPGGADPVTGAAVFRSPLADIADMCWSIRRAAAVAATERGPVTARSKVSELAQAWDERNRRAFLAAYLAAPGIGELVPADRRVVRRVLAVLEAARALRGTGLLAPGDPAAAN